MSARDDVQWVNVAYFGKAAETAATLKTGDRVYCEGAIKLDTWRGDDGTERHTLAVARSSASVRTTSGDNASARANRAQMAARHDGGIVYREACKLGCEGIVSKRLGSSYRSGRSKHWIKIKNSKSPAVKSEAEEDWGR